MGIKNLARLASCTRGDWARDLAPVGRLRRGNAGKVYVCASQGQRDACAREVHSGCDRLRKAEFACARIEFRPDRMGNLPVRLMDNSNSVTVHYIGTFIAAKSAQRSPRCPATG